MNSGSAPGKDNVADAHYEEAEVTPEVVQRYLEYVFPVETFQELLAQEGYTNVRTKSERENACCYDVMLESPNAVEPDVVRQHLDQAAHQIPESPIAHVQWRIELSTVIVVDQQIATAFRVVGIEMAH
jgi:hypothetical protein